MLVCLMLVYLHARVSACSCVCMLVCLHVRVSVCLCVRMMCVRMIVFVHVRVLARLRVFMLGCPLLVNYIQHHVRWMEATT